MIYIGIDIVKRGHVASAVGEDGKAVVESFRFNNTAGGFSKFLAKLKKAGADAERSLIGMEATGHYWIALFDFLGAHGYDAAVINPIQTDAFRDVWTVRKVKTDAIDAAMIADLVRYKRYSPSALGDEATEELRSLARYRMSLVDRSTALKNRATAVLDRVFPELAGLFGDAYCPTHRELLQHCATPDQVLATDVRTLARILREASRGKCGREKAEELKKAAKESVGVSFGSRALALEVRLLMEELDFVKDQIKEVEAELAVLLDRTSGKWHDSRHRRRPRLGHRGRDRRPRPLRRPAQAHGLCGDGPHEERVGRHRVIRRPHVEARAGDPEVGPHDGCRLRQEARSLLRGLLQRQKGNGQEAPLRGTLRSRPQADGRVLGGDERGAALRADAPEEPPARPSQGCLTSLFAKTESSAIASDPMRNRPSVRALYLVFAFQGSY